MEKKDKTYVRIDNNDMSAYLFLVVPLEDAVYTRRELIKLLNDNRVTMGIMTDVIDHMIEEKVYLHEVKVAQGLSPIDGQDGYYDYHFNRVLEKKPKIKEDGSVDYWSIKTIENVFKGQIIATYNHAVQGESGYTVKGKIIPPKRAKDLLPLRGKGFERLEDGDTYVSMLDGKIEIVSDRIIISEIYELFGDADLSVGNIDFPGDVIIHGKVCNGVTINAGGNLNVDGTVEAATITAGKDIVFRSGMLGSFKSSVYAKGNIFAKFFENTTIEAGGMIQADVLMNSKVISCDMLLLNGKKSAIIGGEINAIQYVDSGKIGNESEVPTDIHVGVAIDVYKRKAMLEKKVKKTEDNIARIDVGIKQFEEIMKHDSRIKPDDPRKAQLIRAKIQDNVTMQRDKAELERISSLIEKGKGAYVRVNGYIYPRVKITIDDITYIETARQLSVGYYKDEGEIVTRDLV